MTNRVVLAASLALAAAFWSAPRAQAGPVTLGYSLKISEAMPKVAMSANMTSMQTLVAADRPMFQLSNTSEGAEITGFQITMGDQAYSFGSLIFVPQKFPIAVIDYTPITAPGGHAGAEVAGIAFSGFGAGEVYTFRADIDRNADHGASLTNYRQALAGGPTEATWATIDVSFSDGTTLSNKLTPADVSGGRPDGSYSFFYCMKVPQPTGQIEVQQSVPVPEPSTLALAGLGFAGVLLGMTHTLRKRP